MKTVKLTNGKKTIEVSPLHTSFLLAHGYKLTDGQKMPNLADANKQVAQEKKPLTRKQLQALTEEELGSIFFELKGIAPTVDHNKAKLIDDILTIQDELAKAKE
ncbi:MAG: hypothetical protein ACYC56_11345 [Candidatus Aquicultor sp.]